jgi:chorismate mutase
VKVIDQKKLSTFRLEIDQIDVDIVHLIGRRAEVVRKLMTLKDDDEAVRSPGRVEQVVSNAQATARRVGAPEDVVTQTYRVMIRALTDLQLREYREKKDD